MSKLAELEPSPLQQRRNEGRRTCVAAMRISPDLGVHRLCITPMSSEASARASSVWGTCRFISSPSKSALYGLHTHSLKRNVLHKAIGRSLRAS